MNQSLRQRIVTLVSEYDVDASLSLCKAILALIEADREALAKEVESMKGWDRCMSHAGLDLPSGTCTECAKRKECNDIVIKVLALLRTSPNDNGALSD